MQNSRAVRSLGWIFIFGGSGLAVSGRICDIGQNVLESSVGTGINNIRGYFNIYLLIAVLGKIYTII